MKLPPTNLNDYRKRWSGNRERRRQVENRAATQGN